MTAQRALALVPTIDERAVRLRKDGRPWSPPWDAWTPEQERWLAEHGGTRAISVLAADFSQEFGLQRTPAALRIRARKLSLSLWTRGWSLGDVERLFRTDHRVIERWWVMTGLLKARRWAGRGPYLGWWFEPADVEAFVRKHSYAYCWQRMQPGHPLSRLAETIARRDPWVGRDVILAYVGIADVNFKRWMARGLVPHQRRYGAGGLGEILVRTSELPAIRERIHAARQSALEQSRAHFVAWRRGELSA